MGRATAVVLGVRDAEILWPEERRTLLEVFTGGPRFFPRVLFRGISVREERSEESMHGDLWRRPESADEGLGERVDGDHFSQGNGHHDFTILQTDKKKKQELARRKAFAKEPAERAAYLDVARSYHSQTMVWEARRGDSIGLNAL